MSRIGKHPVTVPRGVEVQLSDQTLTAKGSLGTLRLVVSNDVTASISDGAVTIAPKNETKRARAMWGTTRALVNNMVTGVSQGFSKSLEINGVGYRASVQGNMLNLQLGYSHDVVHKIPAGVEVKVAGAKQELIEVSGIDKQKVGQLAAEIRASRPPEPYQGKGIRYRGEYIRRKEGKKK